MESKIYYPFKVVNKVYCCWDSDIHTTNMEFIESFDPEYFYFTAESFREELKTENKNRAALAIRNIYHHALETLFSLICATLQAPHCIYGWINMATSGDVRTILRLIKSSQKFCTRFNTRVIDWEYFTRNVFLLDTINKEDPKVIEYSELFAKLWRSLSDSFLNDFSIREYNSIKHGLRLKSGGHSLSIGPSGSLNDPSRQSDWVTVSSSSFGSSLLNEIKLIFISIHNILSFLKLVHGAELSKTSYLIPEENDYFEEHWKSVSQTSTLKFSVNFDPKDMDLFTKQELEEMLATMDTKRIK